MAIETKQRNPVAICWGLLLRKTRESRSWQYADIERMSGISQDFYRNIERANFNLHVSQAIPLYNTFKNEVIGETFKMDAIIQILSIISIMEAKANDSKKSEVDKRTSYFEGLYQAAIELSDSSKKLRKLFQKYFVFNLFSSDTDYNEVVRHLEQNEFLYEMEDFLTKYYQYGEDEDGNVGYKIEYVRNFFDNIPSIYTDFFSETKRNLIGIPIKMIFSELQKWELSNENKIEELYVLNTGPFDPTAISNLLAYHYTYLFKDNFKRARFLMLDSERNATSIKQTFDKNLLKAYTQLKLKKPKNWEEGLNKIQFVALSVLPEDLKELLTFSETNQHENYECFWVFRFTNETLVGFVANAVKSNDFPTSKRYVFDEGKNLFISDLTLRYPVIKKYF